MKVFTPVTVLAFFCLLMINIAIAQPSLSKMKDRLIQEKGKTGPNFQIVAKMPGQGSLLLGDDINVAMNSAPQWLADKLQLSGLMK